MDVSRPAESGPYQSPQMEYIVQLQREVCQEIGISYESALNYEREHFLAIDQFTSALKQRLTKKYPDVASIPVARLPYLDFNATVEAPSGEPIILINWGLLDILPLLATVFLRILGSESNENDRYDFETLLGVISVCIASIRYSIPGVIWSGVRKRLAKCSMPEYGAKTLDRNVMDFVYSQLSFVICHEFAHIVLGHTAEAAITRCHLSPRIKLTASFYNYKQIQEFEADEEAFNMLNRVYTGSKALDSRHGAIYTLFSLLHLSELVFATVTNTKNIAIQYPTHPPAPDRWRRVEKVWNYSKDDQTPDTMHSDEALETLFSWFDRSVRQNPDWWRSQIAFLHETLRREMLYQQVDKIS
jgi:hypothetical protein